MGHVEPMWFVFLWEVVKRAFTPTPRVTDGLQILAASFLPAAGKFLGWEWTKRAQDDVLAYIGLVALAFVVIRLFWAPYAIWKDDRVTIGNLKLELKKPERMVIENLARLRAKARMKLADHLYSMHLSAFSKDKEAAIDALAKAFHQANKLSHLAGLPPEFHEAIKEFDELCEERLVGKLNDQRDFEALDRMQRFVIGSATAADLPRPRRSCIVLETPQ